MSTHLGTVAIRLAGPSDKSPVCDTLATAFASGPVAEWLIPDSAHRLEVYRAYAGELYDVALAAGLVYTADAYVGAAVWFVHDPTPTLGAVSQPEPEPEPDGGLEDLLMRLAGVEVADRFALLDEAMATHIPEQPHHHLAFLGVYPTVQGMGIGSALLRHHHHQLDTAGMAGFLVATSRGSRDLYGRHGYTVRERFSLPDGPPLWAMWRDPQPSQSTG